MKLVERWRCDKNKQEMFKDVATLGGVPTGKGAQGKGNLGPCYFWKNFGTCHRDKCQFAHDGMAVALSPAPAKAKGKGPADRSKSPTGEKKSRKELPRFKLADGRKCDKGEACFA